MTTITKLKAEPANGQNKTSLRQDDGRCGLCGGDWAVCGCQGMVNRKDPQPKAELNEWKEAMLEGLAHYALDAPVDMSPVLILNLIVGTAVAMALDPKVSGSAQPKAEPVVKESLTTEPTDKESLTDEQVEAAIDAWFSPNVNGFNNRMRLAIEAATPQTKPLNEFDFQALWNDARESNPQSLDDAAFAFGRSLLDAQGMQANPPCANCANFKQGKNSTVGVYQMACIECSYYYERKWEAKE